MSSPTTRTQLGSLIDEFVHGNDDSNIPEVSLNLHVVRRIPEEIEIIYSPVHITQYGRFGTETYEVCSRVAGIFTLMEFIRDGEEVGLGCAPVFILTTERNDAVGWSLTPVIYLTSYHVCDIQTGRVIQILDYNLEIEYNLVDNDEYNLVDNDEYNLVDNDEYNLVQNGDNEENPQ